ncbi:type II secretion system protein [Pontiella agarivorans]|uniref:Type II secretion system protein n=1 Tax=Pontiella agarivorans TaxID=3038953 RepID=A0ABU5MYR4_9BACT|nr:type II secretion system protein [Pontiella agarivorans]MDZ8119323.1 type II secretion system protein [Pontiella agarivorans]
MKTRGFTLIELLVVMVILGLLLTLGSKGLRAARISAKKAKAHVEMKAIETGVMAYFNKYGKLPAPDSFQGLEDYSDSAGIFRVITGKDEGLNPAKIVFLESQRETAGVFTDPWGAQYQVVLDTDYDGFVEINDIRASRKTGAVSTGLYDVTGNTNDLLFSWR